MTGLGLDGRVVVRTARCRTRGRDRAAVRDALDRLDPDAGLPRSAILVVRRWQGALVGNPPRLEGPTLRAVAADAHRAREASPPPDCEAVLFSDEAELLTSLCREVAADRPLGWWWAAVLGRSVVTGPLAHRAAVAVASDRFARALPAAAAAAPGAVAAAAARLPDVEVLRVTGAMCEAHGARSLAEAVRLAWQQAATTVPAAITAPEHGTSVITATPITSSRPLVDLLVDTALQLHRDPVGARSRAAAETCAARLARPPDRTEAAPAPTAPTAPAATPYGERATPRTGPATEPTPSRPPGRQSADEPRAHDREPANEPLDPEPADVPSSAVPDGPEPDRVDTALGGAFYLLNLLEELDLPDAADGPDELGGRLTRWGVLALVLGAWPDVDPADPLLALVEGLAWPGRARLSGRNPALGPGALRWGERTAEALQAVLATRGLGPGLVRVAAHVECTWFSVRVFLALHDVDLDVRRSGLDRDPGWVPALGRLVELVFR
jgi:hypothetical protein